MIRRLFFLLLFLLVAGLAVWIVQKPEDRGQKTEVVGQSTDIMVSFGSLS